MDERRYEHIAWRYRQGNGPWNYTEDKDAIQADLADEVEKVYADPTPDAPEEDDVDRLTDEAESLDVEVPEHIHETPPGVHTDWIIGSALEDGREAGDTRAELQRRIAAYLEAARRLRGAEREGEREPKCDKCGATDIHTRYCDGKYMGGYRDTGGVNHCRWSHGPSECLHQACRNCGFRWTDECAATDAHEGSGDGEDDS